ncbi:MAG: replication factor C large subunit [Thermoprotei archaeon]|jgi:replication factor C large subunit
MISNPQLRYGLPWTIKHRPRTVEEIVGNNESKQAFLVWLKPWIEGRQSKQKTVMLYGPPGVGKTLLVEVACEQYNIDLIEMNAGDLANAESVKKIAGFASINENILNFAQPSKEFRSKRLILFDEVDSIEGAKALDIINAILEIIGTSRYPVVLIANDAWNPNITALRSKCQLIEFKRLGVRDVIFYLKKICLIEKLTCQDQALHIIAERNNGDMRSSILDLQLAASMSIDKNITPALANVASSRDRVYDVFTVLRKIFYARTASSARDALNETIQDPEIISAWISANLPYIYTDIRDLAAAYDALSLADIFKNVSEQKRYWKLLSYYLELISAGVALSVKNRPAKSTYNYPKSLRLASQLKEKRAIKQKLLELLSKKLHASTSKINNEYLPYLAIIASNPKNLKLISSWLRLDERMISFLEEYAKSTQKQ